MGILNPRALRLMLEDLQYVFSRWRMRASETISTASYTQRHFEEKVERAFHHAHVVSGQAEQDREMTDHQHEKVASLLSLAVDAKKTAHKTMAEVGQALDKAQATLKLWHAELDLALKWLARAEKRLERALADLAAAERELSAALSELAGAESELRSCINDENRRNCNGPRQRVARAQERVAVARAWVTRAKVEVAEARAEVARAQARVQCCEAAVGRAEHAVTLAEDAKLRSEMAVNAAERSVEHAQAAQQNVGHAQRRIEEEIERADAMMQNVLHASRETEEGRTHFQHADRAAESGQRFARLAHAELDSRMEDLAALNQTSPNP